MATARDRAFRILTEREIGEILKDAAGRTPREVEDVAPDKRAKSSAVGFSGFDECEGRTSYWGTWGAV
jgi:hypothetical protein